MTRAAEKKVADFQTAGPDYQTPAVSHELVMLELPRLGQPSGSEKYNRDC